MQVQMQVCGHAGMPMPIAGYWQLPLSRTTLLESSVTHPEGVGMGGLYMNLPLHADVPMGAAVLAPACLHMALALYCIVLRTYCKEERCQKGAGVVNLSLSPRRA